MMLCLRTEYGVLILFSVLWLPNNTLGCLLAVQPMFYLLVYYIHFFGTFVDQRGPNFRRHA